jgi:ATP-dependent exoDNAse (exonuclease V) alpha subunit
VTNRQAVFTRSDLARELGRDVDDPAAYASILARVDVSPQLLQLAAEVRNEQGRVLEAARYSTREMVDVELRMAGDTQAQALADRSAHAVAARHVEAAAAMGLVLSDEQRAALVHMMAPGDVVAVAGAAGAGKSMTLATAREAWEAEGYLVRGAALAGKAAEGLWRRARGPRGEGPRAPGSRPPGRGRAIEGAPARALELRRGSPGPRRTAAARPRHPRAGATTSSRSRSGS